MKLEKGSLKIKGAYLAIGADEASVTLLSACDNDYMMARVRIAETRARDVAAVRAQVYAQYFGKGTRYVFPCWIDGAMLHVVETETYPKPARVLAARIYSDMTYSADGEADKGTGKGGAHAIIDAPKPRKPTGGNKADATRVLQSARA